MFDTIIHKRTEFVPTTVHHHEHRAPTDKSVELLKEMEAAAQRKLISASRLDDNTIKAEWYRFRTPASPHEQLAIRIRINGKEHVIEAELPYATETEEEVAEFVYQKLAGRISEILTTSIMCDSRKTRML